MGNADLGEREKEVLEGRGRTETSPLGREDTSLGGTLEQVKQGVKGAQERSLGASGKREGEGGTLPH